MSELTRSETHWNWNNDGHGCNASSIARLLLSETQYTFDQRNFLLRLPNALATSRRFLGISSEEIHSHRGTALFIGFLAGGLSYVAINWKGRLGYDDSLDVVGIHGVGGILGILATGLFASKAVNASGADGLFFGNPGFLVVQMVAATAVTIFSAALTYGLLKLVDRVVGLRLSPEEERMGLDLTQHDERAYS